MYGHDLLRRPTGWGVHWAGTETESKSGHVDGAVAAGERVAEEIVVAAAAAAAAAVKAAKSGGGGGADEL